VFDRLDCSPEFSASEYGTLMEMVRDRVH